LGAISRAILGAISGAIVGAILGTIVGAILGTILGTIVGGILGAILGAILGTILGDIMGDILSTILDTILDANSSQVAKLQGWHVTMRMNCWWETTNSHLHPRHIREMNEKRWVNNVVIPEISSIRSLRTFYFTSAYVLSIPSVYADLHYKA